MAAIGPGTAVHGSSIYRLGAKLFQGGEGAIYAVSGRSDLYAKIYLDPVDGAKENKLLALLALNDRSVRDVSAWPTDIVCVDAKIVGIMLPALPNASPLHAVMTPQDRLAKAPGTTLSNLAVTAANLAHAVATFHRAGLVVGDLSPANALVLRDCQVQLIDCDSVQINGFPSDVALPEMLPPELQGQNLKGLYRSPDHDAFALAVLVYRLLYLGRHPFAGNGDLSLVDAITQGRHALTSEGSKSAAAITGLKLEAVFSPELMKLFGRAFDKGRWSDRPPAHEWCRALIRYRKSLSVCKINPTHAYPGRSCPWCALERDGRPSFFPRSDHALLFPPTPKPWWEPKPKATPVYKPARAKTYKPPRQPGEKDPKHIALAVAIALFFLHQYNKPDRSSVDQANQLEMTDDAPKPKPPNKQRNPSKAKTSAEKKERTTLANRALPTITDVGQAPQPPSTKHQARPSRPNDCTGLSTGLGIDTRRARKENAIRGATAFA